MAQFRINSVPVTNYQAGLCHDIRAELCLVGGGW